MGFGKASLAGFWVQNSPECGMDKQENLAVMSWVNGKEKTKNILANQPISILANIEKFDSVSGGGAFVGSSFAAYNIVTVSCLSRVTFTPEAGKTYRIRQREISTDVCEVEFIDVSTGQRPVDTQVDNKVYCQDGKFISG